MSTTPPNVLQLARQGNPDAIAALMNRHLEAQGITAHVVQQENTLQVNLESAQIPNQADLVAYVKKGITGLELAAVHHLIVSGKQTGASTSAWSENLALQTDPSAFELDFDAAPDDFAASDDTDLGAALGFDADSSALEIDDLGDLDAALGNEFSGADMGLDDLGLTDSDSEVSSGAADFDLNFDDGDFGLDLAEPTSGPEATDSFDLDLGESSPDGLDLGSGFDDTLDSKDLDLDLALAGEPPGNPTDLDFDLGLAEATDSANLDGDLDGDLDFDLDLAAGPAESTDPTALDFDLDFAEASGETGTDLDFDLGLDNDSGEVGDTSDLDFELGAVDGSGEADSDLDLGWVEEPTTDSSMGALDFGLTEASLAAASAADPATSELGELDFDLADPAAEGSVPDALDLDAADFDLGFDAAGDEVALGSADNLDLDFGAEFEPEADLSLAEAEDGSAAIADYLESDDLDFDLNTPPASPHAPDETMDLDDLWGDSDTSNTAPAAGADGSAIDDLAALDDILTPELTSPDEWADLDADFDSDVRADTEPETPEAEAGSAGAIAFEDAAFLDFESEDLALEATDSTDDLLAAPTAEELVFEDLSSAATLDLAANDLIEDWADASTDLSLGDEAEADLDNYGDLGTDDLGIDALGSGDVDLATDGPGEASTTPFTDNFDEFSPDLAMGAETDTDLGDYGDLSMGDLGTDNLATDNFGTDNFGTDEAAPAEAFDPGFSADWDQPADPDLTASAAPPWDAVPDDFSPGLDLGTPSDFEADAGTEFDPGLVFDPESEGIDPTPNPFEMGAIAEETDYTADAPDFETPQREPEAFDLGAEADLPFSTMELDQTVEGNFRPDLAPEGGFSESNDYDNALIEEQPETYFAETYVTPAPLDYTDDAEADLAFESVEFDINETGSPGFEVSGFGDEAEPEIPIFGADASFEDEGFGEGFGNESFGDEGLGDEGFGDEGFDANDIFSDSHDDSNGFIQDRNGAVLLEDEPDATDDFIQEFGSDPSTHVALAPGQFENEGRGRSGLPLRLIVGLGLGALVLALVGLLLNSVLGRLRQPAPGNDTVVTEPAVPAPTTPPADVPQEDLFRQAVNAAQTAANQAQTASTADQWQAVADSWSNSIELMKRVPKSDPNYAVAQQKVVDYQPNLTYAQQNVQRLK
ncbi:hypothetical protein [Nodosilinea nodulosa]|uniref:hypothetical protein n=1 Tax=Nodosilinea nodulosa TaxID=416001 RepID=UPI0002D5AE5A|nr:hypothetical protein [Nodosilinea nodulosa]